MANIYTILIGVFGLLGIVAAVWSWRNMSKGARTESWPKVDALVITSKPSVEKNNLMPLIEYSYTVDNKAYTDTLKLASGDVQMPGHAENFVEKYPLNSSIEIFYDPKNPSFTTLETGARSDDVFIFWTAIIALALCTIYTIYNV